MDETRLDHRGKARLEVLPCKLREVVLVRDDFALLGHLQEAVHSSLRLGQDRLGGRPASSPDGPSTTMEQPKGNPVPLCDVPQHALGLVDFPLRGRDAGVLVRVGVTEHHLLDVSARRDDGAIARNREELVK